MKKCNVIMITSCKGGVGKSTVSANLALALAQKGKRVMLFDFDFGMRCLDLITGHENDIVYDISDVLNNGIDLERAAIKDKRAENLWLVAAPADYKTEVDDNALKELIDKAKETFELDFIFLDTPGDIGRQFELAASNSDTAIIVANHQITSIRAAEKTAEILLNFGVENRRLIINKFDTQNVSSFLNGERYNLIDIIDRTLIQLLGVIPFDYILETSQEKGVLIDGLKGDIKSAFENIALRLDGDSVPLFTNFKKKRKLKKVF